MGHGQTVDGTLTVEESSHAFMCSDVFLKLYMINGLKCVEFYIIV